MWKSKAWNLGLKRRGKERRRTLARSLRDKSQSPLIKQTWLEDSPFSKILPMDNQNFSQKNSLQMLPPSSVPSQRRQSLPMHSIDGGSAAGSISANVGNKRKRGESDLTIDQETPSRFKPQHRRSSTLGSSIMSAPPHRLSKMTARRSIDPRRVGDGSLLGDTLIRQARRQAGNAKSDTTRTDYFKLKAMGIDPDTPIVPETQKRPRATTVTNGVPATDTQRPAMTTNRSQAPSTPTKAMIDDDEAFFASIRNVRETLADSTSWFQSERQSIERSMTPQTSASPPSTETPAERRLRELRERGPTPTRTEMRLRAMGDKSLLPPGFWDNLSTTSTSLGKGKQGETEQASPATTPRRAIGFAALAEQREGRALVNGNSELDEREESPLQQKGASAEDAIEL